MGPGAGQAGHMDTSLETQQPLVPTSGLLALETPQRSVSPCPSAASWLLWPGMKRSLDELDTHGLATTPD